MDKIDLQQMRTDLDKGVLIAKLKWEQLLSYAIELEATVQRMTAAYDDAEQVNALESELNGLRTDAGAVLDMTDEYIAAMLEKAAGETDDHIDGLPAEPTSEYVAGYFYRRILAALPQQAAPAIPEGWRPIKMKPTNQMPCLYLIGRYCVQGFVDATGELMVQSEVSPHWRKMRGKPTHWMPLPQPPAPEGGK